METLSDDEQQRLRESEARLRLLLGSVAQAMWETDAAGVVVRDSPSWRAYTGQTSDEWLGYGWLDAIHPDHRAFAERQWRVAVAKRCLVDAEFRLRAPEGGWRWTNVRAAPVTQPDGSVMRWAGMNIDIHERKRAEAALRDREARLTLLVAELQHRTRNLLAVVGGIAEQSLRSSDTLDEFGARFERRLAALGRVQGLLSTGPLPSIGLRELIAMELGAHGVDSITDRTVSVVGPDVALSAATVQLLALALHELATNALKHGALRHDGQLAIRWSIADGDGPRRLTLDWDERGVAIKGEVRHGFGRELIEVSLPYELDADTRLVFDADGVRCRIALDLPGAGDDRSGGIAL